MSVAALPDLRRPLQVFDGSRPRGRLLEVVRQLRYDFLHPLRVRCLETLANLTMEPRSAPGQLPVIKNLPVQRMDEFVALGHAAVRKKLRARPSYSLVPARDLLVEILQTA